MLKIYRERLLDEEMGELQERFLKRTKQKPQNHKIQYLKSNIYWMGSNILCITTEERIIKLVIDSTLYMSSKLKHRENKMENKERFNNAWESIKVSLLDIIGV